MDALVRELRRIGDWLATLPLVVFVLLATLLAFLRSGFAFAPIFEEVLRENLSSFPRPVGSTEATSYGMRAVFWAFGVDSISQAHEYGLFVTVGCLVALLLVAGAAFRGIGLRLLVLAIVLGPIGTVSFGNIGRSDVLLLTGSIIVALSVHTRWMWWFTIAGALLMVAGNPEQALAAAVILVVLSTTTVMRRLRRPALVLLGLCVIGYAVTTAVSTSSGLLTRTGALQENLRAALELFLRNFPLVLYSGYTVLWVVVVYMLIRTRGWDRLATLVALIGLPLVLTATTLDQTRVWVGVSSLAVIALVGVVVKDAHLDEDRTKASLILGSAGLAFAFMPAVEVTFEGFARVLW